MTYKPTHNVRPIDPNLCLLAEVENRAGSDYFHVNVVARRRDVNGAGQPELRYPSNGWPYDLPYVSGLRITCQGNHSEPDREIYAQKVSYYSGGDIEADEAEAMAKTLRRIEAALLKMVQRDGRVHSYGHYVQRIAQALGIAAIVRDTRPSEYDVTGRRLVAMNPVEGGEWIDRQIWEIQHADRKKRGEAA